MKSLRLNKELRGAIVEAVMEKWDNNHETPPEPECPNNYKKVLAAELNEFIYSEKIQAVPSDLLNMNSNLKVQLPDGGIENWYYPSEEGSYYGYLPGTKESKVEYVFTEKDKYWIKYQEFLKTQRKVREVHNEYIKARINYEDKVSQVVQGVNTTGQLLEVWPEVAPFLPKNLNNPSSIQLPAICTEELNAELGE